MRPSRPSFLLVSLGSLVLSVSMAAQPRPRRDPEGVTVIQQSIAALGGLAIAQTRDVVTTGMIEAARGGQTATSSFVWKVAGDQFRREMRIEGSERVFVSGNGQPATLQDGKVRPLNPHMALASPPLHVPGLVLIRELGAQEYSIVFFGTEVVAGRPAIRVRTSLEANPLTAVVTPQEWLFEAATGLPLRLEYRLPNNLNAAEYIEAAAEFSDYRLVSGIMMPFRIATYHVGQLISVVAVTSVVVNGGISPSEFDAQQGGAQ